MTAKMVEIVEEVYTRILLAQSLSQFVFNDFSTEKTWYPYQKLETMEGEHPAGKVYVIGKAPDDAITRTRSNLSQREYAVQVGYQRAGVTPSNTTLINTLIELMEQLETVCRTGTDHDDYEFSRLEYLHDPDSGIPFAFMGMREMNLFEAYFSAYYISVLQP